MLGAMLEQLPSRGISEHTREAYKKAQNEFGGRGLQLPEMLNALKKAIASLPRLFICIDALDECTPKHRRELIKSLREIARVLPGARIFITGGPTSVMRSRHILARPSGYLSVLHMVILRVIWRGD